MSGQIAHQPVPPDRLIRLAQRLFYLNGLVWLILGLVSVLRLSNAGNPPSGTLLVVAVLMFGNVGAMVLSGLGLTRRTIWTYLFAVAVLLVNIVLTVTDQFGLLDLLTLALDLFLLVVLFLIRKAYVPWLHNRP